jgi:hypothetical protein
MAGELMKENIIGILQLNSTQIAAQLTLDDFQIFQNVELTEYVDDLYELKSKFGIPYLKKFAEVSQVVSLTGNPSLKKANCCRIQGAIVVKTTAHHEKFPGSIPGAGMCFEE